LFTYHTKFIPPHSLATHTLHRLKSKWVNYQIIDSISWTLAIEFPSPFSKFVDSLHFLSFDLYIIDCLPGGYLVSVLLWSLVPIALIIMNYFICEMRILHKTFDFTNKQYFKHRLAQNLKKEIKNEHFSFVLLLMFTLLPPVVRRQFIALYCFDLQGEQYLKIDSSIDCNSSSYQLFVIFDVLGIIIYMSIPLIWATLLYRQRMVLNPPMTDEYV
jgi:hypothetical protein